MCFSITKWGWCFYFTCWKALAKGFSKLSLLWAMDVFTTVRTRPRLRNGLLPAASGRVQRSCWQSLSSPCRIQEYQLRRNWDLNFTSQLCSQSFLGNMPYAIHQKKQKDSPTSQPNLSSFSSSAFLSRSSKPRSCLWICLSTPTNSVDAFPGPNPCSYMHPCNSHRGQD